MTNQPVPEQDFLITHPVGNPTYFILFAFAPSHDVWELLKNTTGINVETFGGEAKYISFHVNPNFPDVEAVLDHVADVLYTHFRKE